MGRNVETGTDAGSAHASRAPTPSPRAIRAEQSPVPPHWLGPSFLLSRRRHSAAAGDGLGGGGCAAAAVGLLLPFLAVATCLDVPSHGIPKVTNKCGHCKSKLDFGKEFICCSDCSDPTIMDKNSKLGYCKSGADLTMQLKPQETFHWVAGPWMTCSSPCDGGIRYRDVACYGNLDDNTIKHYPVDDASCSADEMPARQEACNQQSCSDPEMTQSVNPKKSGMSGWLVALVVILGLSAAAGIAFTSYTYYVRRTSGTSGFVYVMMEAYS